MVFGILRILLWFWWVFLMPISVGVGWIASRHPALVNFSVHLWCLGPLAKQASVALSSTEAEYVAAASCCSQILWMKQTLQDYGLSFGRVPIFVDNMSAISIAKNPVIHSRTKHIDIRFHFLRDNHERGHRLDSCPFREANRRYPHQTAWAGHLCSLVREAWGLLPLLIADFSLVSFVGFICSSLSFLGLVVALCICIVHFCILHYFTCTSIFVYIAMISWCLLVWVYKRDHE